MRMSVNSYNNMNALLQKCFNANSIIDNLAYNLDYYYFNRIAEVVHQKVAHVTPEWADKVSDMMLQLSARPVRKDINGYEEDINNVGEIFNILNKTLLDIRNFVRDMIEKADLDGDDEVRIFGEDFVMMISPYIKQSEEWMNAVKVLGENDLNIHINDYTHFIAL